MRRVVAALFVAVLCSACTTIQIPLPGASIMRPRAGLGKVGARVTAGAVVAPTVEGAITEVKDPNGVVINPIPGKVGANDDKAAATSPLPLVELAVDWSNRYEVGLSTTRGAFFMWDYAVWPNAALTLTPSYNTLSEEGGDPKIKETVDENGQAVANLEYGYKGKATNFNVTQLASTWVGNLEWAALYVYGGVGVNVFNASITQKESGATDRVSQVAPSMLAGLQVRLLVFELTAESGGVVVKYRDGTRKTVPTGGVTMALHIAL